MSELTPLSALDILIAEYPDPVWTVPEILPAGLSFLSGRPKVGKSWLLMQIAQSIASGGMFLGKNIPQGRTLLLMLEDSPARLQKRMLDQGWNAEQAQYVDIYTGREFRQQVGELHKEGARKLLNLISTNHYNMVAIDTFSRAFTGIKDPKESSEVTAALGPLQEAALTYNLSIIISDHQTRGYSGDPIDDIWQSTAKAAVADNAIGLYRNPGGNSGYILKARGRDVEEFETGLEFDKTTGCYQATGTVLPGKMDEAYQAIKQLKRATLDDIARNTGQAKSHVCSRMNELYEKGLVTRESIGNRVYYSPVVTV